MIGALITVIVFLLIIGIAYFLGYLSFGKLAEGDYCVPDEYKANVTEYVIDSKSNCVANACATGYTLSGGSCVEIEVADTADTLCTPLSTDYVLGGKDYKWQTVGTGLECTPSVCQDPYRISKVSGQPNKCTAPSDPAAPTVGAACNPTPTQITLGGKTYVYTDVTSDPKKCEPTECATGYELIDNTGTSNTCNYIGTLCGGQLSNTIVHNSICYPMCRVGEFLHISDPVTTGQYVRVNPDTAYTDQATTPAYFDPAATDANGNTGLCIQKPPTTTQYTPRRSTYSLRYNSSKLEGIKL